MAWAIDKQLYGLNAWFLRAQSTLRGIPTTGATPYVGEMPSCVLLVDDSASVRTSVRHLFEAEADFEIVGEAEHGVEAIQKAIVLKPHLIILDFSMPTMNGFEAAPILLNRLPEVKIILFTMFTGEFVEAPARQIGIHAVVPKHQASTHLLRTARALLDKPPALSYLAVLN